MQWKQRRLIVSVCVASSMGSRPSASFCTRGRGRALVGRMDWSRAYWWTLAAVWAHLRRAHGRREGAQREQQQDAPHGFDPNLVFSAVF